MQEKNKCKCDGDNKSCRCNNTYCKTCVSCNNLIKSEFKTFMNNHYKNGEGEPTHTSIGGNGCKGGSWIIPKDDYNTFTKLYKKMIRKNLFMDADTKYALVERSPLIAPYYMDIDFHTHKKDRMYDSDFIIETIKRTNYIVKNNFSIDNISALDAWVFEKDFPTKDKNDYKDGFHIMYPNLILSVESRYYIYDKFMEAVKKVNYLEEHNIEYNNDINEVFDKCVIIDNGVLMYGSAKGGRTPYKLTGIFNHKGRRILPDYENLSDSDDSNEENEENNEIMDVGEIIDGTLMRTYDNDKNSIIKPLTEQIEENILENYSNNHSKDNKNKTKKKSKNTDSDIEENEEEDDEYEIYERNKKKNNITEKTIRFAKLLLKIFSVKRATDYESWRNVCWACHNISNDLLQDFLEFSKKAPNYDKKSCLAFWKQARDEGYSIGSLRMWAKEDNMEKYLDAINTINQPILEKIFNGDHDSVATYVHELYKDKYVCVDFEKNVWYEFRDHRWHKTPKGYTLFEILSDEFSQTLIESLNQQKFLTKMTQKSSTTEDEVAQKSSTIKFESVGKVHNLIINLRSVPFKKNIMEACKNKFYQEGFLAKLNANQHLIGFDNGVYSLKDGKFRDGIPEDYISFSTGYPYIKKITKTDKNIQKDIHKFFETCLPNKNVKNYVLRFIASCCDGTSKDQKFPFWVGRGGNGKSVTINMIQYAFGDYYSAMSVAYLTKRRGDSSAASPDLADKVGKRCVTFQESEKGEKIQVSKLKELCGNDIISARGLFQEQMYFTPQAKYILATNELPELDVDGGVKRRVRTVKWEMEFKGDDDGFDPTNPKHIRKDNEINERIKTTEWKQNFMWILINEIYPAYIKDGLSEPQEITCETQNYMKDNDKFGEFIRLCTETTEPFKRTRIGLLHETYLEYHKTFFGKPGSNLADFIKILGQKGYKVEEKGMHNIYVYGIDVKKNDEDEQSEINA